MKDATFFTHPVADWQRRYEVLRASFVERLPAYLVAERFHYSPQYVRLLRHLFTSEKLDFSEPGPRRSRHPPACERRHPRKNQNLPHPSPLLGRYRRMSVRGRHGDLGAYRGTGPPGRRVSQTSSKSSAENEDDRQRRPYSRQVQKDYGSGPAGSAILFCQRRALPVRPVSAQLDLDRIVLSSGLPGSQIIPAPSYLLSFLALKLLGTERYAHVGDHTFDPGLGAFAGLNVIPKCTALSTYSYSLDEVHLLRLQEAFVKQGHRLRLYEGKMINLDFHTVPHYGEQSVLEEHWAGARGKTLKGALTLLAQDADTKLMLYTAADIRRSEAKVRSSNSFLSGKTFIAGSNPPWCSIRNLRAIPNSRS